jgi:Transposase
VRESVEEPTELVDRVCAIDIGKAGLVACMRVPHETLPGRWVQEVREYPTSTPALLGLADWLCCQQIHLVGMEATSDYWKPVFYLLEAEGFTCWLLNAKHVKNVPGRPPAEDRQAGRGLAGQGGRTRPGHEPAAGPGPPARAGPDEPGLSWHARLQLDLRVSRSQSEFVRGRDVCAGHDR